MRSSTSNPSSPSSSSLEPAISTLDAQKLSEDLDEVLKQEKAYETEGGLKERKEVLKKLGCLIKQWIQSVSLSRGMHWNDMGKVGGSIVTYGSYMLGISHQGADIDALCIAPQHISRQEYFTSLIRMLDFQREITELRAIQEAYVPVIKMRFSGIEIDMTFTRLNMAEIPDDLSFLSDINITQLEAKCIRSLNGYRATLVLLQLIPNKESFQMTLRAIKLWAKSQGLYSNSLGYLGGFSWAVMVAKVCQLNPPDAKVSDLVRSFFEIFSKWEWPKPVALNDYESKPPFICLPHSYEGFNKFNNTGVEKIMSSWNPEVNAFERHQVMPIITPTYPHQNSTFNVSLSTCKLIRDKMIKALALCEEIAGGKDKWDQLFKTHHILEEFNHFIVIRLMGKQNYIQWFGLIESKLRHFVTQLEKENVHTLESARIWPKPLTKKISDQSHQLWIIGLEYFKGKEELPLDIKKAESLFRETCQVQMRGSFDSSMVFTAYYVHKSDIRGLLNDKDMQEFLDLTSPKREATPPPQTKFDKKAKNHELEVNMAVFQRNLANVSPTSSNNSSSSNGNSYLKQPPPNMSNLSLINMNLPPPVGGPLQPNFHQNPSQGCYFESPGGSNVATVPFPHQAYPPSNFFPCLPPPQAYTTSLLTHPVPSPPSMERTWSQSSGNKNGHRNITPSNLPVLVASPNRTSPHSSNSSLSLTVQVPHSSKSSPSSQRRGSKTLETWTRTNPVIPAMESAVGLGLDSGISFSDINRNRDVNSKAPGCGNESKTSESFCGQSGDLEQVSAKECHSSSSSFDSDLGRSVSFSSDKFPTQALVNARMQQMDNKIASPSSFSSNIHNCNNNNYSSPLSSSGSKGNHGQRRSSKQSRYSSMELRDITTPLPVSRFQRSHFNFNPVAIQQMQANDSVFHP